MTSADQELDGASRAMAGRVAAVLSRIASAAARAGRDPASVALVAVTKAATPRQVVEALSAGVAQFGENRVADAEARIAAVDAALAERSWRGPRPRWRFIGHLQTNKAKRAVAVFDSIDSVDSIALAERLSVLAGATGRVLPVLLEVNLTGAAGRSGFAPDALAAGMARIAALPNLAVEGVMAIGPHTTDPAAQRAAFSLARTLRNALVAGYPTPSMPTLSMGMSDDFEAAVEEGSTVVRIGRALFGQEG